MPGRLVWFDPVAGARVP